MTSAGLATVRRIFCLLLLVAPAAYASQETNALATLTASYEQALKNIEFVHKPFTAAQVAGALRRELDREG